MQNIGIRPTDSEYHNYFYDQEKRKLPSHTKAIFKKIGILAFPNLIAKSCPTLMHKVYMGVAPSRIESIFEKSPRRLGRIGSNGPFPLYHVATPTTIQGEPRTRARRVIQRMTTFPLVTYCSMPIVPLDLIVCINCLNYLFIFLKQTERRIPQYYKIKFNRLV